MVIFEGSAHVGGRSKTIRFSGGNDAEGGTMRLLDSADPKQRKESHWLTI